MRKGIIYILSLLLAVLMLSSCQKKESSGDRLADIMERGKLIIAMEGTWAPWTYHDESGALTGYDAEVGRLIAQKLGVDAEFVEGEWDGLLAGLAAGRYDLVINGVDITDERSQVYDFSEPYAYNRTAIIVRSDDDRISSVEDLKGMKTANTISSTYAEFAEQYGADVLGVDDLNETLELLRTGRIDATLNAEVVYYDYMKVHPDAPFRIAVICNPTEVAIPMRKGDETASLRAEVNRIIGESGAELSDLSKQFFGADISKAE